MEDERVIVIALDGSPQSEAAFDWYMDNSMKENDHVVIVTCFDRQHAAAVHGYGTDADTKNITSRLQNELDSHKTQADKFREKLRNAKVKGEVIASGGKPGEVIVHVARDKQASMVICGSRGHGSVQRTIMGSISTYVVNHCHIPVVVCRNRSQFDPANEQHNKGRRFSAIEYLMRGRRNSAFEQQYKDRRNSAIEQQIKDQLHIGIEQQLKERRNSAIEQQIKDQRRNSGAEQIKSQNNQTDEQQKKQENTRL